MFPSVAFRPVRLLTMSLVLTVVAIAAAGLLRHLEELASAITEARPAATTIPALPGQPLTVAATVALTSAVPDAQRIPASS